MTGTSVGRNENLKFTNKKPKYARPTICTRRLQNGIDSDWNFDLDNVNYRRKMELSIPIFGVLSQN